MFLQTAAFGDAVYGCSWENEKVLTLRKSLILAILRSRKPKRITAAGIVPLDNSTFVKVGARAYHYVIMKYLCKLCQTKWYTRIIVYELYYKFCYRFLKKFFNISNLQCIEGLLVKITFCKVYIRTIGSYFD